MSTVRPRCPQLHCAILTSRWMPHSSSCCVTVYMCASCLHIRCILKCCLSGSTILGGTQSVLGGTERDFIHSILWHLCVSYDIFMSCFDAFYATFICFIFFGNIFFSFYAWFQCKFFYDPCRPVDDPCRQRHRSSLYRLSQPHKCRNYGSYYSYHTSYSPQLIIV